MMWSRRVMQVGMRRRGMKAAPVATLGALLLLGGCTAIHVHRGYIVDNTLLQTVQPGIDNKYSVEQSLGRPTFVSQFGQPTWYYVSEDTSQPPFRGPHATKETVLRVRFDAHDNVASVDSAGVDKMIHVRPDGHLTPTLGRKRTFLQDLFGNIGTVGAAGVGQPGGDQGGGGGGGGGGGSGPNGS